MLVGGYADGGPPTRLPLRVLEIGASAGLNLRFDHFAYDTGRGVAGDPDSPVRFDRASGRASRPTCPDRFDVAERRGCDRHPIDATTPEGRRTLMSYVWPDQTERLARLEAAIEVARRVPVAIDQADAAVTGSSARWPARRRASPPSSSTRSCSSTSPPDRRRRFRDAVASAGSTATDRRAPGVAAHGARRRPGGGPPHHLARWRRAPAGHGRVPRPPHLVGGLTGPNPDPGPDLETVLPYDVAAVAGVGRRTRPVTARASVKPTARHASPPRPSIQ